MSERDEDEYEEEMRAIAAQDSAGSKERGGLVEALAMEIAAQECDGWPFDGVRSYDKAAATREWFRDRARRCLRVIGAFLAPTPPGAREGER